MAKAKSRQVQRAEQRARSVRHTADSERMNRTLIVGGIVAVVVIALGVIGFGWWQTQIRPLGKTVLEVGDIKFNLAHVERRMELELQDNPFYAGDTVLQLPDIMYERLVDEATLLQAGTELPTITLTEEDLAAAVRERSGLADDVEATVFANEFRRQVEDSGLKENEYRQMLRAQILQDKVRAFFTYTGPTEEAQVLARWIVVNSQQDADDALERLTAGEDFVAVARDLSLDVSRAEQGASDEDWTTRGFVPNQDLEDFLFDEADVGQLSGLVITGDFYYIAELIDRNDSRPLTDVQRANVGDRELQKWLDGVDIEVTRNFSQDDAIRALNDVLD